MAILEPINEIKKWDEAQLNWIKEDDVWLIEFRTFDGGPTCRGKGKTIYDAVRDGIGDLIEDGSEDE